MNLPYPGCTEEICIPVLEKPKLKYNRIFMLLILQNPKVKGEKHSKTLVLVRNKKYF